jgi:sulfonate transport system permease protein
MRTELKNIFNRQKGKIKGSVLPLIILIAWWIISSWQIVSPHVLPGPERVIYSFILLLKSGDLIFNVRVSLIRVVEGFFLGSSIGFVLGTLMGLSRTAEKLLGHLFHAVRQVPLLGWIPLIILWCGIGEISKIVFIAFGSFYPAVLNTFEGIRGVSKQYVEVAKVFEYDKANLLRKVILPAALPSILTGLRLGLSISWMLVVGAEIFFVTAGGVGAMMWEARERFQMDIAIVGIIVIGMIGLMMNESVKLLEARFLRWRKTFH